MPYYGQGDYYRGGDYYAAGGIFGTIGKALGGVARIAGAVLPGPLGTAGKLIGGVLAPRGGGAVLPTQGTALAPMPPMRMPALPPVQTGPIGPFGAQTGGLIQVQTYTSAGRSKVAYVDPKTGKEVRKRKRINVANPRALRRALRRVAGFGKLARRAKRDIGRAASAIGVRRGGGGSSRGVITRSEAARALRR